MAIEYSFSRVEANCVCKAGDPDEGKVCEVIVGMTAVDGETSAYIDTTVFLTGDARSFCNLQWSSIGRRLEKRSCRSSKCFEGLS
jgi:hypothetical protein